jgi:hypothetical protein
MFNWILFFKMTELQTHRAQSCCAPSSDDTCQTQDEPPLQSSDLGVTHPRSNKDHKALSEFGQTIGKIKWRASG